MIKYDFKGYVWASITFYILKIKYVASVSRNLIQYWIVPYVEKCLTELLISLITNFSNIQECINVFIGLHKQRKLTLCDENCTHFRLWLLIIISLYIKITLDLILHNRRKNFILHISKNIGILKILDKYFNNK